MDPAYDEEKARALMDEWYSRRIGRDVARKEKAGEEHKLLSDVELNEYQVVHVEQPRSWRVTRKTSPTEEVTFYLYGVVCDMDLPPLNSRDMKNMKKKALYIRQSIRVTGIGNQAFENAVKNVQKLANMVMGPAREDREHGWQPAVYEGQVAIDCSARYFTTRRAAPQEKGLPFGEGVDPSGMLARLRGHDLIHGPDNNVVYLKEESAREGVFKTNRATPAEVEIGDLVKVTLTIVGYASKGCGVAITPTLKAVTVVKKMSNSYSVGYDLAVPRIPSIKRKRVFEEYEEAREGIERMDLCDHEGPSSRAILQ